MNEKNRKQTRAASWPVLQFLSCLALTGLLGEPLLAAEPSITATPLIVIGVLAHDQGPFSDHNEHGIDLNLEAQFAPLHIFGAPRPHLGATLNFTGDTSAVYAGLTFPLYQSARWFLDGSISAAVHKRSAAQGPDELPAE